MKTVRVSSLIRTDVYDCHIDVHSAA